MTKFRKMHIGALGLTVATTLSGVAAAGPCGACGDDVQIEASIRASFQKLPYLGPPNTIRCRPSSTWFISPVRSVRGS